jgi:hydrogenase expression/formation protein HypC
MCLGIPGRIEAVDREHPDLARVEVAGLTRNINIGILDRAPLPGEWVLIQAGFAIEIVDEETARTQLELLSRYTGDSVINEEPDFDWDTMSIAASGTNGRRGA